MPDRTVEMIFSRFQSARSYVWEIILLAVILALAIHLVGSDIYNSFKGVASLGTGLFLIVACLVYISYARVRANKYSVDLRAFFVMNEDTLELLDIRQYEFASSFYDTFRAISKENPAFDRQWRDQFAKGHKTDLRLASEISEYIILDHLSNHLADYFNTSDFAEDRIEELSRKDIPDVLLSNRVLELISRDLQDRPWYKPEPNDHSNRGQLVAVYGPDGIFSRFDLTLPNGSKVERSKSGSLIITSKMLTLELGIRCDGYNYGLPLSFERYYFRSDGGTLDAIGVSFKIQARLKRRFGLRSRDWPYYLWLESFIESAKSDMDADSFFRRISWNSLEIVMSILEQGGIIPGPPHSAHHAKNGSEGKLDADSTNEDGDV